MLRSEVSKARLFDEGRSHLNLQQMLH